MDKFWRKNNGASDVRPVALKSQPGTIAFGWARDPGDGFRRFGSWAGGIE